MAPLSCSTQLLTVAQHTKKVIVALCFVFQGILSPLLSARVCDVLRTGFTGPQVWLCARFVGLWCNTKEFVKKVCWLTFWSPLALRILSLNQLFQILLIYVIVYCKLFHVWWCAVGMMRVVTSFFPSYRVQVDGTYCGFRFYCSWYDFVVCTQVDVKCCGQWDCH